MMETKHTEGPWYPKMYLGPSKDKRPTWGVRNVMFSVCNLTEQDMADVENGEECATAHLIAAAPELLQSMQDAFARGYFDSYADDGEMEADEKEAARAAIAKASPPPGEGE